MSTPKSTGIATDSPALPASGSGRPLRQPAIFLPHGGGPCFFMEWPAGADPWVRMGEFLRGLAATLPERPRAWLIVSAHWEEAEFTVNAGAAPGLLYDYNGFPEHTYHLKYPAPGAPALAQQVRTLLSEAGLSSGSDAIRGYDHGVFVPMLLIDPSASVPVLQLSLRRGLDPASHLALGRALASLRDEGIAIIGSGMSYHNLRGFGPAFEAASVAFDDWLAATVESTDAATRDAALTRWADAPQARTCHPREEHLLPLMVVAGAAGDEPGQMIYRDRVKDVAVSAVRFG